MKGLNTQFSGGAKVKAQLFYALDYISVCSSPRNTHEGTMARLD